MTLGAALGGGPPLLWVAEHRLHHRYSDTVSDPHDAGRGFWYSHVGHLFYHKDFEDQQEQWMSYIPDLSGDSYYRFLNRYWIAFAVLATVPLYFWGGWTYVLWIGFVRVVLMLHLTWFVNSASHLWGYESFKRSDGSKNCWWVGFLAAGEGWHNNHHAYPKSAAHGRRWWEVDSTYYMICVLERLGLAKNVQRPMKNKAKIKRAPALAEAPFESQSEISHLQSGTENSPLTSVFMKPKPPLSVPVKVVSEIAVTSNVP